MISIRIGGVDRTSSVEYDTFGLQRAITNQVDTLKMSILRKGGAAGGGYKPSILDSVVVAEDSNTSLFKTEAGDFLKAENGTFLGLDQGTILFGGQIIEVNAQVVDGSDIEKFDCICKDYSYDMDKTLVIASYESETIENIIADIAANFLDPVYDISNVSCTIVANFISFNYEYPSKCLQQLAELVNYDWYVDSQKKIYFFQKGTLPATYNLTDTSENYYFNSLVLKDSLANLRNSVIVRGGQYLGSLTSETVVADGQRKVFTQGNQYNSIFVKVNAVSKTVGIANIDDPLLFDCLYNFQEKYVVFPAAVTSGQTVEVGGLPYIPVIVKVRDTASIAAYGEHQFKIIDKSINSKEGARDRAKAELAAYASTLNEGSFQTRISGLDVGQQINVQSDIRGTDTDYVISRISTTMTNGRQFLHSVTLVTVKTYGMIEFLMQLLMQKDKEIVINEGEVTDQVESTAEVITVDDGTPVVSIVHNPQSETISVGESTTVQALDYAVEFGLANLGSLLMESGDRLKLETSEAWPVVLEQSFYYPSGVKRVFILDGSPLG